MLSMVLLAPACMAQSRTPPDETRRSAFGQVMEVMIDALQREAMRNADPSTATHPAAGEVRTTAAGTPLGIEVGDAFRLDRPAPSRRQRAPAVDATETPPRAPDPASPRALAVQDDGAG